MFLTVFTVSKLFAQVGIGNASPQATLHVDGAKDNPVKGVPNSSQQSNDVVVNSAGQMGVGTISPTVKLHVVADAANANRFSLIDFPTGTSQYVGLALRNTAPLATGNYSLLGFTNSGPASGGANWGLGSIRTGSTSTSGTEEEFLIGQSTGGFYNERLRINAIGNVGIGTSTPNQSAILELSSTSKGLLPPRLTTAQRDAINPKPEGLMIYNLDIHCMQYWNSTMWVGNCGTSGGGNTITDCTSGALNGTYTQGVGMNSSNTVTITVNVAQTGVWSIISNVVNGVSWSGTGTFTSTGAQNVTLTASGTPTNSGTFNYTFTLGTSTCSRNITFDSPGINPCQGTGFLGRSDFPNTYSINGVPVYVTVTTSGTGPGAAYGQCGGQSNTDSWGIGVNGASTTTFTYSKPVTGAKFNITLAGGPGETITVSAKNGSTTVNPLLSSGQSCFQQPTVTGNNVTESGTFTVGATVTSITITHNGGGTGAYLHAILCGATAQ